MECHPHPLDCFTRLLLPHRFCSVNVGAMAPLELLASAITEEVAGASGTACLPPDEHKRLPRRMRLHHEAGESDELPRLKRGASPRQRLRADSPRSSTEAAVFV